MEGAYITQLPFLNPDYNSPSDTSGRPSNNVMVLAESSKILSPISITIKVSQKQIQQHFHPNHFCLREYIIEENIALEKLSNTTSTQPRPNSSLLSWNTPTSITPPQPTPLHHQTNQSQVQS